MKPLNYDERKKTFIKFFLTSLLLLGVYAYSIYSFNNVKSGIQGNAMTNNSEMKSLDVFFDKANELLIELDQADSKVEKGKFVLEINKLILEEKPKFITHKSLFSQIENQYQKILETREDVESNYAIKILELEGQIENFEKDSKDGGKDIGVAKAALGRIANDLNAFGQDFSDRDWCRVTGSRRSLKQELKDKLNNYKNDILLQTSTM